MRAILMAALAVATLAADAAAQNEAALRAAFEGKTVNVKIDMPATSEGVDVYPQDAMPVDFRKLAERLKDNGTALRIGQPVMITKVVVKRNSHIEFQLGGGGYGTLGDLVADGSDVSVVSAGESKEERALRDSIKANPARKKQFEKDLSGLRAARERENARAAAEAAQANAAREANLRAKRLEAGSRFNVRYRNGIPPEGLTPDGVMRALAQFVEFPGAAPVVATGGATSGATSGAAPTAVPASALAPPSPTAAPAPAGQLSALKKGLTLREVEAILGPAATAAEVKEGSMTVTKRTYTRDGMKITASFVSDVLVDFAIVPA